MEDIDKKIGAMVRADRMKKLKVVLGLSVVFLLLIWYTFDNKGGTLL